MKTARKRPPVRAIGRPRAEDRPPGFTRSRLLEAAADVFADEGYVGASIQAIAARADVTSATIYRHFGSKADLLLGVVEQAIHAIPMHQHLTESELDPPDVFFRMVSIYAEPDLRRVRRLAIEIHAAASRDPEAADLLLKFNQQIHRDLASRLKQCVSDGQLPADLDASQTASLLLVIIMGLSHLDTLEPGLLGDNRWRRFLESSIERLLDV